MIICYLIDDCVGAYSKKHYAPAGTQVYIMARQGNMARVTDTAGNTFWDNINNLTTNKNATNPRRKNQPTKGTRGHNK